MRLVFDVQRLYYLPQYEPVMRALTARGAECIVIARDDGDPQGHRCRAALGEDFVVEHAGSESEAVALARRLAPDWVIVGNDNPYRGIVKARSALLYHGIGVKRVYYSAHLMNVDLRFVEGPYRARELAALFPDVQLEAVGFPKLDPLFNGTAPRFDLAAHGLDNARRSVLYAPTFFPSSIARMPLDWPAALADCNVIIKPHQFSLAKSDYRDQQQRFARWAQHANVFVADESFPSLVPFMAVADLLISEASSALFEFAALDRPIVWCDFLQLRWSYRGPFAFRLRQRMDQDIHAYAEVGAHAAAPAQLLQTVRAELAAPEMRADARARVTAALIGATDGNAAARAAAVLLEGNY